MVQRFRVVVSRGKIRFEANAILDAVTQRSRIRKLIQLKNLSVKLDFEINNQNCSNLVMGIFPVSICIAATSFSARVILQHAGIYSPRIGFHFPVYTATLIFLIHPNDFISFFIQATNISFLISHIFSSLFSVFFVCFFFCFLYLYYGLKNVFFYVFEGEFKSRANNHIKFFEINDAQMILFYQNIFGN